ncbi:uncharacterized protein LOC115215803 [Octopus sinensis]|uniref:Uncharacterized protein LOC115215803 n=1 Tax=Octopus sinensis TaxID=2607531 RepID=A0A6P7SRP0_9MOLL|nr:uncharacterized protein LOC115215803 [Octopus sinensis]
MQLFTNSDVKYVIVDLISWNLNWLCERVIQAPKNSTVSKINEQLLQYRPGSPFIYKSVDTIPDPEEVINHPTEFLSSSEPPGPPPHRLELILGTPVMLLKNLDPSTPCSGTRLVVKKMIPHVIEVTIFSGCRKGEDVSIPRFPLIPLGAEIPFSFRRV